MTSEQLRLVNLRGSINKYLLALNCHPKIGGQTLKKILAAFDDDAEKVWRANQAELKRKLEQKIVDLILESQKSYDPQREVEKVVKLNIGYITIRDKEYPALLKELPDAPALLFIKGDIAALKIPSLAIVGSRRYSAYGKMAAWELTKDVAGAGLAVVSGLALGIDTVAHRAALEVGGITIGVLGCGLDRVYPACNVLLMKQIIDCGGAVISELPLGTPPLKHNFPARNRIIAGLALGTLVVEAAESSGSLITALAALEYNREVFAVPGNISSETSVGANKLIQKGAKLVTGANDIFEELRLELKLNQQKAKELVPENPEEEIVIKIIGSDGANVDKIIQESEMNIIAINTTLTLMEMKGMVENVGGVYYKRI